MPSDSIVRLEQQLETFLLSQKQNFTNGKDGALAIHGLLTQFLDALRLEQYAYKGEGAKNNVSPDRLATIVRYYKAAVERLNHTVLTPMIQEVVGSGVSISPELTALRKLQVAISQDLMPILDALLPKRVTPPVTELGGEVLEAWIGASGTDGSVVRKLDESTLIAMLFPKIAGLPSVSEEAVERRYFEENKVIVSRMLLDGGRLLQIAFNALQDKDSEGELRSEFRALLMEFRQQLVHLRKIDAVLMAPASEMAKKRWSSYEAQMAELRTAYAAQRARIVERFTVCLHDFAARGVERGGIDAFQEACLGLNYFYDFFVEQFTASPDAVELLQEKDEFVVCSRSLGAEDVEFKLWELRIRIREIKLELRDIDEKITKEAREETSGEREQKARLRAEMTECESELAAKELSGVAKALLPATDVNQQASVPSMALVLAHSDVFSVPNNVIVSAGNTERPLHAESLCQVEGVLAL